jgi:hypothetical protein
MSNKIIDANNFNENSTRNEIKTSNIKEVEGNSNNMINNKYYDINKKDQDNKHKQTELSIIIDTSASSDLNEDDNLNRELDSEQINKLNSPMIKEEQNHFNNNLLLYGNSINDLTPKRLGKMFAFCYINQKPLIVIGPDCKNNF